MANKNSPKQLKISNAWLDYQKAWIMDDSPMKIYEKSRQIGITYSTSFRKVMKAMKFPGLDCWCISRDEFTSKEFINLCKAWCKLVNVYARFRDTEKDHIIIGDENQKVLCIEFPNGSRILGISSNPNAIVGKHGDIFIDEFAIHRNAEELIDIAMPAATWGYQVEIVSTHRSKFTQFNQLIEEIKIKGNPNKWSYHRTTIEDAIEAGLNEKINKKRVKNGQKPLTRDQFRTSCRAKCRSDQAYLREYMCVPSESEMTLLPLELIKSCEMPVQEIMALGPIPKYKGFVAGYDVGRHKHLSALAVLGRKLDINKKVLRKIATYKEMPFDQQLKQIVKVNKYYKFKGFAIDGTGMGENLGENCQKKIGRKRTEIVKFSNLEKGKMANDLYELFENNEIIIPENTELRADLNSIEETLSENGDTIRYIAPTLETGHADRFWAIALAVRADGNWRSGFQVHVESEERKEERTISVRDKRTEGF